MQDVGVMRSIEIRRHSYTKKGEGRGQGSHLSAEGVALARVIGATIGPCEYVLTSQVPRTLETAIAMGFAVDEQLGVLGDLPPDVFDEIGHHDRWTWEAPFTRFAQVIARQGATARLGQCQREAWIAAVESVSAGGRVLVISHGRIIEAGVVTCFPDADMASWGGPFQHCEGVRLQYDEGRFTAIDFLRLPHPR
jgi:broad specificity phosphatase PhoE